MAAELESFVSENQSVSHDVVNSLSSVRSLSELLVEYPGLDDGERTRFLNIIREETERLMHLLTQLKLHPDLADPQ